MSEPTAHPARTDHNIWPGITSPDPIGLRTWLQRLGFVEGGLYLDDDGVRVRHSEMLWPEGGRVMISSAGKSDGTFEVATGSASIYVVVNDPDAVWKRARSLDPVVLREPREEDYGSRGFSVADPDGNAWSFGTYGG